MTRQNTERLAVLVVCLAASLPYLGTLSSYFVGDDFGSVQLFYNQSPRHFFSLFTQSWHASIWGVVLDELRPFPALLLQLAGAVGRGSPVPYHAISIAIHIVNTLLVLAVARHATGLSTQWSALVAILFAIHPVQAETVSWITSQSESVMTMCCLASLWAWIRWRQTERHAWAALSLGFLFCALFCKQTAIVTLPLFVAYDALIAKLDWRNVWRRMLDYVPAALLTGSYLLLRLWLFSDAVRESSITLETLRLFALAEGLYVVMVLSGDTVIVRRDFGAPVITAVGVSAIFALGCIAVYRCRRDIQWRQDGRRVCFAATWWLAASAPTVVAAYVTSRHIYLASVGAAIGLVVFAKVVWNATERFGRFITAVAIVGVMLFWLAKLDATVEQWETAGDASKTLVESMQQYAQQLPQGSLVLLDVPSVLSSPTLPPKGVAGRPWIWAWAMPFAAQPPFTRHNLSERIEFIVPLDVYCCPERLWAVDVASTATRWLQRADRPPAQVFRWDAATASLSAELHQSPEILRGAILQLSRATTPNEIHAVLNGIFTRADRR